MIIRADRTRRWRPRFYRERVMRDVNRMLDENPGFHRFVLVIAGTQGESGYMVNPDIEPELRRLLDKLLVLSPPVEDSDPWPRM